MVDFKVRFLLKLALIQNGGMCTDRADVRSDNVHRAGGCSVRQFSPSRWVFGHITCTEQADVRSDNVHRACGYLVNVHREGGCWGR